MTVILGAGAVAFGVGGVLTTVAFLAGQRDHDAAAPLFAAGVGLMGLAAVAIGLALLTA